MAYGLPALSRSRRKPRWTYACAYDASRMLPLASS